MSNPLDVLYQALDFRYSYDHDMDAGRLLWKHADLIADVIRAVDSWEKRSGDVDGVSTVDALDDALAALKTALAEETT